jgi:hypothetical protein
VGAFGAARSRKKASRQRRRFRNELRFARQRATDITASRFGTGDPFGQRSPGAVSGFASRGEFLRSEFEGGELQRSFTQGLRAQQASSGLFASGARQEAFASAAFQQNLRGQLQPALTEQSFAPERFRQSAFLSVAPDIGQERTQSQDALSFQQTATGLFGGAQQFQEQSEARTQNIRSAAGIGAEGPVDMQELLRRQFTRTQSRRRLSEEQQLAVQRQEASQRLGADSPLLRRGGAASFSPSEVFKLGGLASNSLLRTGGFDVRTRATTGEGDRRLSGEELTFLQGSIGSQEEGQRRLETAQQQAPDFQQQAVLFGREGALQRRRQEAEQRGGQLLADRSGVRNAFGVPGSGPGGRS